MAKGNILSANHTNVTIDGSTINGLQAISFKKRVNTEEIYAIGHDERIDVSFGKISVNGVLIVKSYNPKLDDLLKDKKSFQIVIKLKKQKGLKEGERQITFDEVFLEGKDFDIKTNETGLTKYYFTATRIRES